MITSDWENNGSFYPLTRGAFRGCLCRLGVPIRIPLFLKKKKKKKKKSPATQATGRHNQHILFFFSILFSPFTIAKRSILLCTSGKGIKVLTGLRLSICILWICWPDLQSVNLLHSPGQGKTASLSVF